MNNALLFQFYNHPDLLDESGRNLGFSDYIMPPEKQLLRFPTHYRLVATLEVKEGADPHAVAERLFAMTNSIDSPWFNKPQHVRLGEAGISEPASGLRIYTNPDTPVQEKPHIHRSTSCGDVVVVPKGDDYVYLYCDAAGFKEIDAPIYPVDLETVTPTEIGPVSVVQTDPDSFDLFDMDGECINEGDPIYGRRPSEAEVKGYAAAYGDE